MIKTLASKILKIVFPFFTAMEPKQGIDEQNRNQNRLNLSDTAVLLLLTFPKLHHHSLSLFATFPLVLCDFSTPQETGNSWAEAGGLGGAVPHQARPHRPRRLLHPDGCQRGQVPGHPVSRRQATGPVPAPQRRAGGGVQQDQTAQGHHHFLDRRRAPC